MAANSQMFARLLPIDIKFFNGESPSPQKLNGIFNYVQAAFYILESFLGNGTDYKMPMGDPANRKMLFNVSQVLGNTGKLYRPVNIVVSNETLYKNLVDAASGVAAQSYDKTTDALTLTETFPIPVYMDRDGEDFYVSIHYTGGGSLSVNGTSLEATQLLPLPNATFRKFAFLKVVPEFISHITLTPTSAVNPLVVEAIHLSKASTTIGSDTTIGTTPVLYNYNKSYAIPLDNIGIGQESPTFWTIKSPCRWAVENACSRATCGHCIGNIYDIDVDNPAVEKLGAPICGGLANVNTHINADFVPRDTRIPTLGNTLEYTEADFTANPQSQVYTIQAPLLMKAIPYMMRFRPFSAHDGLAAGDILTKNESVVYDLLSRTNPVRYNIPIYSAGRPDIVYVFDPNKELVIGDSSHILIVGGSYTMTEFISDLVIAMTSDRAPINAVYAD